MCQSFLVLGEISYTSSVIARIVVSKVDLQGVEEAATAEEEDSDNSSDEAMSSQTAIPTVAHTDAAMQLVRLGWR
ncbi:hypothetical protein P154DRAFT_520727 [Amniculicola lignicola CBS 123094]|uniref:Uncharacterized protein n=1 Tax=Amniculicola lignicola CBS 123094 TaxID=1392246 RepID=A0A6A5WQV8_9PLEO|nr:hypothetical protein P154DRAFT_520727 [Amniculicola lignicola CBS 123094]